MTAQPLAPAATLTESVSETGFWTLLTVASISKQVGELSARAQSNPSLAAAVASVEAQLEAIILTAPGSSMHGALLELTKEVDYQKRS